MTKDEALRLALEALGWTDEWRPQGLKEEAITAIKAALEAKDEPVAWKWHQAPVKTSWGDGMVVADLAIDKDYTASIYCEREQTTKVEAMFTPPQRKPLTDEEIQQIFIANSVAVDNGNAYIVAGLRTVNITRAIEAKLKEKNT